MTATDSEVEVEPEVVIVEEVGVRIGLKDGLEVELPEERKAGVPADLKELPGRGVRVVTEEVAVEDEADPGEEVEVAIKKEIATDSGIPKNPVLKEVEAKVNTKSIQKILLPKKKMLPFWKRRRKL